MKPERRNNKPFSQICFNSFGREVIYTNETKITEENILNELSKALAKHSQNREEISYLEGYYKSNQPILYRSKEVRPEIKHNVVVNTAFFIVETKVGDIAYDNNTDYYHKNPSLNKK